MKAHRRTKRALRMLALSGCVTALALPAAAGAQPVTYPQSSSANSSTTYHPHGVPAAFAGATRTAGTGQGAYSPPAGFQTDAQSNGGKPASYSPPAGFVTDRQTDSPPPASTQTPSVVVREVHTITDSGGHT